jgi:hypothetical protein
MWAIDSHGEITLNDVHSDNYLKYFGEGVEKCTASPGCIVFVPGPLRENTLRGYPGDTGIVLGPADWDVA